MKSCVIFSCTILTEDRLFVLHRFLQIFESKFSNYDIFIGINHVSLSCVEDIIRTYNINVISMDRCLPELYSLSDASAYQIALKHLYESKKDYENYWFIHTKSGVNSHSDYLREWYIDNLLSKSTDVETFINSNNDIGSYGMLGLEYESHINYENTDCEINLMSNILSNQLPCTHANFFYIHTIYVINNKPIKNFFKLISPNWFTNKLDRYYFEGVFPFIVSRSGYFPYLENRFSCSFNDLHPYIERWINSNNLENYKKYLNLFKTDFIFQQERPPYVNSNT